MLRSRLELLEPRLALANGFINDNGTSVAGFFVGGGVSHNFVITAVPQDSNHDGRVNTNTLTLSGRIDGPGAGQFTDTHSGLSVEALNAGTSTVIGSTTTFSGTADQATFSGLTVSLPSGQGSRNVDLRISRAGFGSVTILRSSDSTNLRGLFVVDTVRPTVTINQAGTQSDPTSGSPIRFSVVFSESVTGFTSGDVSFSGSTAPGTLVASITGSGSSYTVSVSGMTGSGTVAVSIPANAASDATGNLNTASTSTDRQVTYDVTGPTVTINQAAAQADPTSTSPINFSVVFNESVTGFTSSDVQLSGTAGATTAEVTGSGANYNVAVSGMTASGTVTAMVVAGAVTDSLGNASAASTSTDGTVTYDVAAPVADILDVTPDPRNTAVASVSISFEEPVTGVDISDFKLTRDGADVSLAGLAVGGGGANYSLNLNTATTDVGTYVLTLMAAGSGIADLAGNLLAADAVDSWVIVAGSPTAPTITNIGDQTTLEDIATTAIAFTIGDDATLAQNLLLSASSSDETLVPIANIEFGGAGASRTVIVRPAAELSGDVLITIFVEDADQERTEESFELIVKPVNDAPRFVAGPDQTAKDEDAEQVIPAWASDISRGPANESTQALDFLVENDANQLFAVQPAISSSGQLTFTPAGNAHGTAQVTVRLMDDGGTADGGDDVSDVQVFQIEITKPFPKHNTLRKFDVDGDGGVFAGDALDVINQLNAIGARTIPDTTPPGPPYFDTSRDKFLSAGDALDVINFINAFGQGLPGPEGEPAGESAARSFSASSRPAAGSSPDDLTALISLLAMDSIEQTGRRRRGF
jgi:hypothetical protein